MQLHLSVAAALSLAVLAQARATDRLGLFCCPKTAPNGAALTNQLVGPFALTCSYGDLVCKYAAGTGHSHEAQGCPAKAVVNPNPPACS
ncbi:hypothetical protein LshimejAT787_0401220 [Lyophyllum shimeji]|uniref:Uncharacterized protein n=1 Tax=Lyophyllum shimeji TaxID=47721 RepID=A0A9P3PJV0_LYOSH|nr:hypothetical protein LshimejAT787_0401220 [Lyophyllum shimeji]